MVAKADTTPNEFAAPLKVMVSDIRDQYANALRVLLEPHGFAIHRITSGADAIWLAERRAVDAAVLDNDLPDMPGIRVLRAIRSLDLLMPIILVGSPSRTAAPAAHEHLLRSALEFQAFSVLAQPVDLEVLLGQMARLFDRFLSALRAPGEDELPQFDGREPPAVPEPTRAEDGEPAVDEARGRSQRRRMLRFRKR